MMGVIVSKFGGTSMAGAEQFARVREIVRSDPRRRFIILSAPGRRSPGDGKITELLLEAARLYSDGLDGSAPLDAVRSRFAGIISQLGLQADTAALLGTLDSDVRRCADYAASRGEYLCARLFALYADLPFCDAARLIRFDDRGRLLPKRTRRALRRMADRLHRAVIPGFYGSLPDGTVKTFPRGGSDITGALVAAALDADIYENWTDVDGLMSADPQICPDAVHHSAVSYRQMRRLSLAGANVLHPACLAPVRECGIATLLRNTFAPDGPGTLISDQVARSVPCMAVSRGLTASAMDSGMQEAPLNAEGLLATRFISASGGGLLSADGAVCGATACLISLFALPAERIAKAVEISGAVGYRIEPDCLQLLTERTDQPMLRQLHRLLLFG